MLFPLSLGCDTSCFNPSFLLFPTHQINTHRPFSTVLTTFDLSILLSLNSPTSITITLFAMADTTTAQQPAAEAVQLAPPVEAPETKVEAEAPAAETKPVAATTEAPAAPEVVAAATTAEPVADVSFMFRICDGLCHGVNPDAQATAQPTTTHAEAGTAHTDAEPATQVDGTPAKTTEEAAKPAEETKTEAKKEEKKSAAKVSVATLCVSSPLTCRKRPRRPRLRTRASSLSSLVAERSPLRRRRRSRPPRYVVAKDL